MKMNRPLQDFGEKDGIKNKLDHLWDELRSNLPEIKFEDSNNNEVFKLSFNTGIYSRFV